MLTHEKTNGKPLISVIVPVYNVEKYIHRCVDSIINQTYTNLEIILVDDGSPDRCSEICDEYANKDSRIKVIHQKNSGLSAARNAGLDICTGDYIAFVDSDDYLDIDYFQVLESKRDNVDFIGCGFKRIKQNGTKDFVFMTNEDVCVSGKELLYKYYDDVLYNIGINPITVWGKLYKKEIWNRMRFLEGIIFEDMYLMPQILLSAPNIKFISYDGYNYREVDTSITNDRLNVRKGIIDSFNIWNKHIEIYKELNEEKLIIAVERLKADKLIAHIVSNAVPNDLKIFAKDNLRKSILYLLKKPIKVKSKIRYLCFLTANKYPYVVIKRIIK